MTGKRELYENKLCANCLELNKCSRKMLHKECRFPAYKYWKGNVGAVRLEHVELIEW